MRNIPRPLFWIIIGGLLLRVLFLWTLIAKEGTQGIFTSDSAGFFQIAENMLSGHGFSRSDAVPYEPTAHFPPLYPLLIAGSLTFTSSVLPLILIQLLISGLLPFLLWKLAGFITESKNIRLIIAGMAAFEPLSIFLGLFLITDTIATALFLLGLYFFLEFFEKQRTIFSALSGVFLALAVLTRPNAQFLFIAGALVLFVWGIIHLRGRGLEYRAGILRTFTPALGFALAFLIILSPWLARNYIIFGTPSVATTGLRNIYTDFAVSVLNYETGRPYTEIEDELITEFAKKYNATREEIKNDPRYGTLLAKEGFSIVSSHPKASSMTLFITLNSFFTQDLYLYFFGKIGLAKEVVLGFSPSVVLFKEGVVSLFSRVWHETGLWLFIPFLGRLFWIGIFLFGIAGAWFAFSSGATRKRTACIFLLLILYFAAVSMVAGFSDHGRHRYPISALLFILASYGAVETSRKLFRGLN